MTFYERMDALATRQIADKGSTLTISARPTASDPVTGAVGSDGEDREIPGVVVKIDYRTFPETMVQAGDKMLLLDGEVEVGEKWGGMTIVAVSEVKPDNSTSLLHKALVRG